MVYFAYEYEYTLRVCQRAFSNLYKYTVAYIAIEAAYLPREERVDEQCLEQVRLLVYGRVARQRAHEEARVVRGVLLGVHVAQPILLRPPPLALRDEFDRERFELVGVHAQLLALQLVARELRELAQDTACEQSSAEALLHSYRNNINIFVLFMLKYE